MTHIKDEVGKMMPKQELHTHNSIPSYTADLDEGCVICSHNKILENATEHLAKRVASDEDVDKAMLHFVVGHPSPVSGICIDVHDTRKLVAKALQKRFILIKREKG